jgi:hypothetical protein
MDLSLNCQFALGRLMLAIAVHPGGHLTDALSDRPAERATGNDYRSDNQPGVHRDHVPEQRAATKTRPSLDRSARPPSESRNAESLPPKKT